MEQLKKFSTGQTIVKQGSRGEEMYVVRSGKVRIFREQDGEETTLATLQPGAFFGEMALFDNQPRSASANAMGETEVRVVTKAEFDGLDCDPLLRDMLGTMAQRLRQINREFENLSIADERRQQFMSKIPLRREWTL